jgi:hypothetical protein
MIGVVQGLNANRVFSNRLNLKRPGAGWRHPLIQDGRERLLKEVQRHKPLARTPFPAGGSKQDVLAARTDQGTSVLEFETSTGTLDHHEASGFPQGKAQDPGDVIEGIVRDAVSIHGIDFSKGSGDTNGELLRETPGEEKHPHE